MTLDQELKSGFIVQCRVIAALMLREVHTINGNSKLGYLWVLVQSAFPLLFLGVARIYECSGSARNEHGNVLGIRLWCVGSF